jgi:ketosteroid isomerase-like protein
MAARTPAEVHELFARHFSNGDIDSLMSLYEPGAMLVQQTGQGLNGLSAIREILDAFLMLKAVMNLQVRKAVQAEDLALLMSTWTLKGTGASGEPVELSGQTSDVVRRQADGSWLLVIDVPYGAEIAGQTTLSYEN